MVVVFIHYVKCSTTSNTFLVGFKMLVIKAGICKMLVRIKRKEIYMRNPCLI